MMITLKVFLLHHAITPPPLPLPQTKITPYFSLFQNSNYLGAPYDEIADLRAVITGNIDFILPVHVANDKGHGEFSPSNPRYLCQSG